MKYIDAEKLKRFVGELKERAKRNRCDSWGIVPDALEEVEGFIDSLQQEQPNKYETALEKARKWMPNVNQGGHAILIDIFPELGEGLDPRYGGRKQEQPEELEKKIDDWYNTMGIPVTTDALKETARHFYELGLNAIKED